MPKIDGSLAIADMSISSLKATRPFDFVPCSLIDLVDLRNGKALSPEFYVEGGDYPVFGSNGRIARANRFINDGPVLIIGRVGAYCGAVHVSYEFSWVTDNAIIAKPRPGVDFRFLYYKLLTLNLPRTAIGSAQPLVTQTGLATIQADRPPLAHQRAVGSILGAFDDKIAVNMRTSETLEAMARALFKSWFVDFDPVRAKSEGRMPAGMDAETAKLFPEAFDGSDIWDIPKGWKRAALGEWATASSGGTPSKSNPTLWGGDIPWISPKAMKEIHADESDECVTPDAIGNGTRLAPAGSTLVMVRGMGLHEKVRVSQTRRDVTFNQDVKALAPNGIEASLLLFALLDAQQELLGKVESSGHGTGKLASEILLAHPITMPPTPVQKELGAKLEALNAYIASARAESRTLAELRDTILPKLISGEVRIKDAEKLASAVL